MNQLFCIVRFYNLNYPITPFVPSRWAHIVLITCQCLFGSDDDHPKNNERPHRYICYFKSGVGNRLGGQLPFFNHLRFSLHQQLGRKSLSFVSFPPSSLDLIYLYSETGSVLIFIFYFHCIGNKRALFFYCFHHGNHVDILDPICRSRCYSKISNFFIVFFNLFNYKLF